MDVLSGDLEAELGYYGALRTLNLKDGALFDIGGGSTEIVEVRAGKILRAQSLPLGSLNLFKACVSRIWPKPKELEEMRKIVRRTLAEANLPQERVDRVCGVGGTARALLKIANTWYGRPELERRMTPKDLHQLNKELQKQSGEVRQLVLNHCPDRLHTILPGALLMDTVTKSLCEGGTVYQPYRSSGRIFVSQGAAPCRIERSDIEAGGDIVEKDVLGAVAGILRPAAA